MEGYELKDRRGNVRPGEDVDSLLYKIEDFDPDSKQDVIDDLQDIRTGAGLGATAYQKPQTGIPSTDLADGVQTSLGKADTALQSFTEQDPVFSASVAAGITSSDVSSWNAKQDAINDLTDIRSGASAGATAYQKPSGGIPSTDMASAVQTSLGKADTAIQTETDPTVPAWAKQSTKPTYTASEVGALPDTTKYASSKSVGGAADKTVSIPFGAVDSTSTSTAFTAQIDGITELRDGVCVYLRNNKVTSAAGCTLDINGLGAKPIYSTMAAASGVGAVFNVNYTMLFIYNSSRVSGGCWDMYYGYNTNDDVNAYNVKELYNGSKKVKTANGRYMLFFTCADGMLLPVNTDDNVQDPTHVLTTESFNPFGEVYYYNSSTVRSAGATIGNAYICSQFTNSLIDLRYSFNTASTLTAGNDVYLVCVPQNDGQVKLAPNPIAFHLPITEDGLVYKRLGKCYDTYRIILEQHKPCYCYKDGAIRLWTNESDFLSNGAVIEEDFLSRETHRDAVARVQCVKGRTVVWNQLIVAASKTGSKTHNSNTTYSVGQLSTNNIVLKGHKVIFCGQVSVSAAIGTISFQVDNTTLGTLSNVAADTLTNFAFIGTIGDSTWHEARLYIPSGLTANDGFVISWSNTNVFDLTQMFGTGNEPSIEEFEALFTEDSYSYNAGEVLNVAMTGLKTKDASQTDLDSIALDVTQITSGGVAIFPNGLNGIGNVRDEIDFVAGKAVKRCEKRAYTSGDVTSGTMLTDGTSTVYILVTPVEYTIDPISIDTLETVNGGEEIVLPVGTGKPGVAPAGIKEQLKSSLMSRLESLEARVLAIENS